MLYHSSGRLLRSLLCGFLLLNSASSLAASLATNDPDITPDTVYHRAGQLLPLQSHDLQPFEQDPLAAKIVHFPPVSVQTDEFTEQQATGQYTDEELMSRWGRNH